MEEIDGSDDEQAFVDGIASWKGQRSCDSIESTLRWLPQQHAMNLQTLHGQ